MSILESIGLLVLGTALGKYLLIALGFALPLATFLTWMERRQSAYTQDRYGPRRAHFFRLFGRPVTLMGLLHVGADAIKTLFKEPFTPQNADRMLFRVAPLIGFVTPLVILALIPFGPDVVAAGEALQLQVARLDAGVLIIFAIGSLGVYGAALAGWASNSRFALLGGLRASAQSISYEIALGLAAVGILIAYGTTELSAIVGAQTGTTLGGVVPNWGLFIQPLGAALFLTAAIAETKRTPFDMPEGESEIIGYFVEYSSMDFGMFMLGEFVEVVVLGAVFTTLFLGGWQLPWVLGESTVSLGFWSTDNPWVYALAGLVVFGLKVFVVCALQIQLRWTLPRFRYDQLMSLGWKNLLPLTLANIFVTTALVWIDPSLGVLHNVSIALIILFAGVVIAGPRRRSHAAHTGAH